MKQVKFKDLVMASINGVMVQSTKVNGKTIKQMEKALFGMQVEIYIQANLKMIWLMGTVYIFTRMEVDMKECGTKTSSMAMEKKSLLTVLATQENIRMLKRKDMDFINGPMEVVIKVNGTKTKLMAKDFTHMTTVEFTMVILLTIICMEKEQ